MFQHTAARRRLVPIAVASFVICLFQHTAARRRLGFAKCSKARNAEVSTHSRPKAAGTHHIFGSGKIFVSTHSRPKAAGHFDDVRNISFHSFNTQPPEGGWTSSNQSETGYSMFQHTAARRRLVGSPSSEGGQQMFQHTAARRRLVLHMVSIKELSFGFNTQPPEGGWRPIFPPCRPNLCFNTQPPEGGWDR